MRQALILRLSAIALFFLPAAWGQNTSANWGNLKQLERGHRVQVVETNLKSTRGKFVSYSDSELVLEVDKGQVTIPREKVFRVSEDHRRGRNALIAGLVGAGVGAGIGAAASREVHTAGEKGALVAAGIGVWGGIFAGVSALVTRNPTVYRVEKVPAPAANAARPQ